MPSPATSRRSSAASNRLHCARAACADTQPRPQRRRHSHRAACGTLYFPHLRLVSLPRPPHLAHPLPIRSQRTSPPLSAAPFARNPLSAQGMLTSAARPVSQPGVKRSAAPLSCQARSQPGCALARRPSLPRAGARMYYSVTLQVLTSGASAGGAGGRESDPVWIAERRLRSSSNARRCDSRPHAKPGRATVSARLRVLRVCVCCVRSATSSELRSSALHGRWRYAAP